MERRKDGKTETEKWRDCEIERWGDGQRDRGTKRLKDGEIERWRERERERVGIRPRQCEIM